MYCVLQSELAVVLHVVLDVVKYVRNLAYVEGAVFGLEILNSS